MHVLDMFTHVQIGKSECSLPTSRSTRTTPAFKSFLRLKTKLPTTSANVDVVSFQADCTCANALAAEAVRVGEEQGVAVRRQMQGP